MTFYTSENPNGILAHVHLKMDAVNVKMQDWRHYASFTLIFQTPRIRKCTDGDCNFGGLIAILGVVALKKNWFPISAVGIETKAEIKF